MDRPTTARPPRAGYAEPAHGDLPAADGPPTVYGHVAATGNAIQSALATLDSLEGRMFGSGEDGELCKPPAAKCLASIAAQNREDAEVLARRLQSLAEQIGG